VFWIVQLVSAIVQTLITSKAPRMPRAHATSTVVPMVPKDRAVLALAIQNGREPIVTLAISKTLIVTVVLQTRPRVNVKTVLSIMYSPPMG
jgi:hypothetical protein